MNSVGEGHWHYRLVRDPNAEQPCRWHSQKRRFYLIGWPDHLLVGSVREDNVAASIVDKKFASPEF